MLGLKDDQLTHFIPRGAPPFARIILILVLSVGLMSLDNATETLDPLKDTLSTIMQPLLVVAEFPADAFDFAGKYIDRDDLIAHNNTLESKILLLKGKLQKLAALKAENARLRNLTGSGLATDERVIIAQIMSISPSPYRQYITINKGTLDDVRTGQAIIDANGIMGQVVSTTPMTATAILITDPNHTIPVEINRTGLQTIARGRGRGQQLILPFLPANTDIQVGDLLVSSGLGKRYPAGYPVATVTRIAHKQGEEFLTVLAEPKASLNRGREVLVIWSPAAKQSFTPRAQRDKSKNTASSEQKTEQATAAEP